jgi:hypothetical protein
MIKCQILYKKFNNDKKQVLNSQLLTTITNNKLSLLIIITVLGQVPFGKYLSISTSTSASKVLKYKYKYFL